MSLPARPSEPGDQSAQEEDAEDPGALLDAIDSWVRGDIANEAVARCVQDEDPQERELRLREMMDQSHVELRAAVRLISMATLRMESRRAALRWLTRELDGDYQRADDMAQVAVADMRGDTAATSFRHQWARQALARMSDSLKQESTQGTPAEPLANADDARDLAALDACIDQLIDEQERTRKERWEQLGPAAVAAREALAIEQLAVARVLLTGFRVEVLGDLLAVAQGLQIAAMDMIANLDTEKRHTLMLGCEQQAQADLRALSGQDRYRKQLVDWASLVAQDLEGPSPIELRSVAPRSGSQGSRTPAAPR